MTEEGNIRAHRLTQMDIARANAERLERKRKKEGLVLRRVDHKTWVYVQDAPVLTSTELTDNKEITDTVHSQNGEI